MKTIKIVLAALAALTVVSTAARADEGRFESAPGIHARSREDRLERERLERRQELRRRALLRHRYEEHERWER